MSNRIGFVGFRGEDIRLKLRINIPLNPLPKKQQRNRFISANYFVDNLKQSGFYQKLI